LGTLQAESGLTLAHLTGLTRKLTGKLQSRKTGLTGRACDLRLRLGALQTKLT
jgi:hypothetical protein